MKITEVVANSPLGAELTEQEIDVLTGVLKLRSLEDGAYLMTEGSTDNTLFVLLYGRLEVVKQAGGEELVSLAVLREGDLAGELSFIDGLQHTAGIRALGDCEVMLLSRDDVEKIIDEYPRLTFKVMSAIARATHRIIHRMNFEFMELNNYIFKQHGRY